MKSNSCLLGTRTSLIGRRLGLSEEEKTLDELEEQWRKKTSSDNVELNRNTLRAKLRLNPQALSGAAHSGNIALILYLQSKRQARPSDCGVARLNNKPLASELYFRVKANETSFEEVARTFGEGPERHEGGLIPLRPLGSMPFGLAPVLERLEPGQISQPMRLGKGFCLVELIELQISQLDEETGEALLAEQLRLWIDRVVDEVEATLRWPEL